VKCDCTSRAKTFAVAATDSIFDAGHISFGAYRFAISQCSFVVEVRKQCFITFVSGENFCCDCGSLWAK